MTSQSQSGWTLWRGLPRALPYLRPYRKLASLSVTLMVLASVAALAQPWPLATMIDTISGHEPKTSALFFGHDDPYTILAITAAAGFFLVVVTHGLTVINSYVDTKIDQGMVLDLRSDLFEHCQRLSLTFHDDRRTGELMSRINQTAASLGAIVMAFPPIAQSLLTLVGMIVIAVLIDWQVTLIALSVLPLIYYSLSLYGKRIVPRLQRVQSLEWQSLSIVNEAMSMLRVIVSFGRERHEHRRFREQGQTAVDARVSLTVRQTAFNLAVTASTAAGTALVFYFGFRSVFDGRITIGELIVLLSYIAAIYSPIEQISSTIGSLHEQFVALNASMTLLDTDPEVKEDSEPVDIGRARGEVSFDGVAFAYKGRPSTLKDISFEVRADQRVAIVGPTGAGKTTLASLLIRFYDPQQGEIRIDGVDIRRLTLASLRSQISVVLQEPLLFSGTVASNILYGRLDAEMDEIVEAAKAANAHDFISRLPQGYETVLGERGAQLSGGERQRLAVARAFLKDAPILILDEPTSSIDSKTEEVILDALDRLVVGRTSFMIAHRLSTIRDAEVIFVMDDGRIVERGTHDELFEQGGLYRRLTDAQTRKRRQAEPVAIAKQVRASPRTALDQPDQEHLLDSDRHESGSEAEDVRALPSPQWVGEQGTERAVIARPERTIVLLGMMTKMPVAGVVWQTVHYLVGLRRLGWDVYYVESHARTPSMLMEKESDDGSARAATFIESVMRRFDLQDRWAYVALHDDHRCYGMSREQLDRLYKSAALIVNLHGGTEPMPEHSATGRLVYVETDPVQLQIELHDRRRETIDFLEPHCAFFTFAENYGRSGCLLPVSDRFSFLPTRQPVVLDFWQTEEAGRAAYTTVANWRQPWRDISFQGELYRWSKDSEFLKVLDLPGRTAVTLELALSGADSAAIQLLEENGWHVRDGLGFSRELDPYRQYLTSSRAEFTVAKEQNVRFCSGWFSDRSATYLAAGRPVVTQDTAFGAALPTGEGLLPFLTLDEAQAAIEAVEADYSRHARAAAEIARSHFDSSIVLRRFLSDLDLAGPSLRPAPAPAFPPDLDLAPASRRPTVLLDETTNTVLAGDISRLRTHSRSDAPGVSVVVVVHDGLPFTRLCIESILASTDAPPYELVVVDNGSADGTKEFLDSVGEAFAQVRVLRNDHNLGFPAGVNRGIGEARAQILALANNDVVVTPGWLSRLTRCLADPDIGLAGAVTNRIGNEAEIEASYRTYGELLAFADERARLNAGVVRDLGTATMFCLAMRREVWERLGPLDEEFGLGTLEDDDYSARARAAGLRIICAEDAFVHHFGEASFGRLVSSGQYDRLLRANRRRYEEKWGKAWRPYLRRQSNDYDALRRHIRALVERTVPERSTVAVVSRGDEQLVCFDGRRGWHFPRTEEGFYAGHYPADSREAIAQLEAVRQEGGDFLLLPRTGFWWLDHYDELRAHLAEHYAEVARDDTCVLFSLKENGR